MKRGGYLRRRKREGEVDIMHAKRGRRRWRRTKTSEVLKLGERRKVGAKVWLQKTMRIVTVEERMY